MNVFIDLDHQKLQVSVYFVIISVLKFEKKLSQAVLSWSEYSYPVKDFDIFGKSKLLSLLSEKCGK